MPEELLAYSFPLFDPFILIPINIDIENWAKRMCLLRKFFFFDEIFMVSTILGEDDCIEIPQIFQ